MDRWKAEIIRPFEILPPVELYRPCPATCCAMLTLGPLKKRCDLISFNLESDVYKSKRDMKQRYGVISATHLIGN